MSLKIRTDFNLRSSPGKYNAQLDIVERKISLPLEVAACAPDLTEIDAFLGLSLAFPSSFAAQLNWKPQQVLDASKELMENLVQLGLMKRPQEPPKRTYGLN